MKKLVLIMISILLFFTFVGCSNPQASNVTNDEKAADSPKQDSSKPENTEKPSEDANTEKPEEPKAANEKPKVLQEYSFGPKVDASTISQETKDKLQQLVNELGKAKQGQIDFNGFNAYYMDNKLYVELFVRNGTDKNVFDINGRLKVKKGEEIIASGNFTFGKDDFGVLEPDMSRVWTIIFAEDAINVKKADLTSYSLESNVQYRY